MMQLQKPIQRHIDYARIRENYTMFKDMFAENNTTIAPVLKANGYGLGAEKLSALFHEEGSRTFFTSDLSEALPLAQTLPAKDTTIFTLHGYEHANHDYYHYYPQIIPIIHSHQEMEQVGRHFRPNQKIAVQFDSGMNRHGIALDEAAAVSRWLNKHQLKPALYMTHLYDVRNDIDDPQYTSHRQIADFNRALPFLPKAPTSISATHGSVYLDYLQSNPIPQDIIRSGVGLLGDIPGSQIPFRLDARINHIGTVSAGETIGYDGAYRCPDDKKIATLEIGYSDGYPYQLGTTNHHISNAFTAIAGYAAPIVGKVSMNMMCVDVSDIPDQLLYQRNYAEIVGPHVPLADLAELTHTPLEDLLINFNKPNPRASLHDTKLFSAGADRSSAIADQAVLRL